MVSVQGAGLALAPIAGSIATWGLALPYWVTVIVTVCGFVFAATFLREASSVLESEASGKVTVRELVLVGTDHGGLFVCRFIEFLVGKPRRVTRS